MNMEQGNFGNPWQCSKPGVFHQRRFQESVFPTHFPQDTHYEADHGGSMLDISENFNWPLVAPQAPFSPRITGKITSAINSATISFIEESGHHQRSCFLCNEPLSDAHRKHVVTGSVRIVDGAYFFEISLSAKVDGSCQTDPLKVVRRKKPATAPKTDDQPPLEPKPTEDSKQKPKKLLSSLKSVSTTSSSPLKKKKRENLEKNIKKLENQKKIMIRKFMNQDKDKENLRKCDKCPLGFGTEEKLANHVEAVHLGFRPHMCKICGKSFHLKKILKQHLVAHQSKPVFSVTKVLSQLSVA